jgi:exopolysaccharide biosynthesis WecB/TagA/CpsF family protein
VPFHIDQLVCELDDYDLPRFVEAARSFGQQRFGYAVTPNVDHLIRLHEDAKFRELYAEAEYVLMDSRFLNRLMRLTGGEPLPVCTGSDVTERLLCDATGSKERIVIIGGTEAQVGSLARRFDLKNIAHYNPPMGFIRDPAAVEKCLRFVEVQSPFRFCLLALGSPQQEIVAQRLRRRGVARGLALCVGASIDFMTGVERRAPLWMRQHGLEWLHRLLQNPARMARRYLVRGPQIFWLLRKTKFVLRDRSTRNQLFTADA